MEIKPGDDRRILKLLHIRRGKAESSLPDAGTGYGPEPIGVSAVPMPQPAGTITDGCIGMSRTGVCAGYSSSSSHSSTASLLRNAAPSQCNPGAHAASSRLSESSGETHTGSHRRAAMSSGLPFAVKTTPVIAFRRTGRHVRARESIPGSSASPVRRIHGNIDLRVKELARCIGEVGCDLDGRCALRHDRARRRTISKCRKRK